MSELSKEDLENGKIINDFVANRKNQEQAMALAGQLKSCLPSWFTARDVSNLHRPLLSKMPLKYGKTDVSVEEARYRMLGLYAFGLVKIKKGIGKKADKFKITMEAAAKAIGAHNRNMIAVNAITKKALGK